MCQERFHIIPYVSFMTGTTEHHRVILNLLGRFQFTLQPLNHNTALLTTKLNQPCEYHQPYLPHGAGLSHFQLSMTKTLAFLIVFVIYQSYILITTTQYYWVKVSAPSEVSFPFGEQNASLTRRFSIPSNCHL